MRFAMLGLVALLAASPATAQREAISSNLSPEAAAEAFNDAVIGACVPAVLGNGVGGLPAGVKSRLQASSDAETRKQAGAAAGDAVWDVLAARGVVVVHEQAGRCIVSVYGPPAMPTVMGLAGRLTAQPQPFERLAAPQKGDAHSQSLIRTEGGKRIVVQVSGSEPGMTGHKSRFSVVTATVFAG